MALKAFTPPPEAKTYIATIRDRCHDLINCHIWTGIQSNNIDVWLQNFKTDEEKYFAACILDSLIYRSNAQTKALAFQLLFRSLPDLTRRANSPLGVINDWQARLQSNADPKIRLVTAMSKSHGTATSGFHVSRLMRQEMGVNSNWIIKPEEIKKCLNDGVEILVFIDDLLGTGQQFKEICDEEDLLDVISKNYVVFAPLVAHKVGIEKLKTKCASLHVVAAEYLDENASSFNTCFNDNINSPESAQAFYDEILKKRILEILNPDNKYGIGNLALAYLFEHGSPDNSLHILWDKQTNWDSLHKK